MERLLEGAGIAPVMVHDKSHGALERVEAMRPDVVCLDLDLDGMDGRDLISELRSGWPEIGGRGRQRVCAIRISKWIACGRALRTTCPSRFHPKSFLQIVRKFHGIRARRRDGLERAEAPVGGSTGSEDAFAGILTRSPALREIFRYAASVASSTLPILVTGETGTGKELMAKALHQLRIPDGPFVAINTAGLDDAMFSDTLFGHAAGAFTGGEKARSGLVETAREGTLFLDEIGDLSPASQVKLLRLLQENEYYPVGSDRPRRSRCRFVLATHKDLADDSAFRKDLYWRLCSHRIHIPPLRERLDDVDLLCRHFVAEAARDLRRKEPGISDEFLVELRSRAYPGNIRELRGFVFDQVARCAGTRLDAPSWSAAISVPKPDIVDGGFPTLAELQSRHIACALERTGGNRTVAADLLGISRQTLITHLKKDAMHRTSSDS